MSRRRPLHQSQQEDEDLSDGREEKKEGGPSEQPYKPSSVTATTPHNPLAWLALPFHLTMVIYYVLLLQHGSEVMHKGKDVFDPQGKIPSFGGRFKYLTHICQWVQLFFFALQLVTDLSPAYFKKRLQMVSDFFFTGFAFPLSAFVTFTFWGIYAINRELVYPAVLDQVVPTYLNHFWHTTIVVWGVFEMYLFHHCFPSLALAAINAFIYGSLYIGWVMCIYLQTGWWVYPVLSVLPPFLMAVFFASSMFFSLGLFVVGRWLHSVIWGVVVPIQWE